MGRGVRMVKKGGGWEGELGWMVKKDEDGEDD